MMENNPNEYNKIDKLSDEVYSLGINFSLRMNVSLSNNIGGKRNSFHKEYEYSSSRADNQPLVTIKRNFDYYLSIEGTHKEDGEKVFIRIGPSEYYAVKKGLDVAHEWFTGDDYKKLFVRDNGAIVIMPPIPEYVVSGLPMGKFLRFTPVIVDRGPANVDKLPGLRMFLSSDDIIADLVIDRFMGLHYTYSTFVMYHTAIEMINYLGRPEFGFNRFSMLQQQSNNLSTYNNTSNASSYSPKVTTPVGRFVTPVNTKKSIKELE